MSGFASIAALTLAASLGAAPTPPSVDNPFDHVVPLVRVGDRVPATTFVDQTGHRISLDDLRGQSLAIAFVYTRCRDACPIITRKLGIVRAGLGGAPVRLIEVTIDPEHDDAAVMAAYAHDNRMDAPVWLALTGEPGAVADFDRRMGVLAIASGRETIIHNDRIVIADPDGAVTDVIEGASWTPDDLLAEVRHAAGRASSPLARFDLAVGAAVAFCGSALSGRAGIADVIASALVIGGLAFALVWFVRRTSSTSA